MPKLPVLLMVQALDHGGCERDAAKIALGLDRKYFEPHVGVLREGGFRVPEVRAAGVPVVHFPVTSLLNTSILQAAHKMGAYIRQHGIQLLHTFDVPTNIVAAPVARWYRVPAVITSQLSFRSMYTVRQRMFLRLTDRLSDFVVVNSRAVGNSLEREIGLPPEKIYLCYNGVNLSEFFPGAAERPPELRDASVIIGSVCVMRPEKRIDWVIRAFAEVRQTNSGARLLLVGSGPELPRLTALRDSLGLSGACVFVPGQPDVADWMRTIDIYINSSCLESFPNGLLEAMACGCCVIGSRVGGIPELVSHGENGLTFDPDKLEDLTEALRLVLHDSALRQAFKEKAWATARERFSMKINLQRTEALYHQLLQKHKLIARNAA
ncbi:MAG: glycosyltransferase [Acidobacteriaceae bacterium]|nr:glycosyltransferase [Acidobacteriaceae bacterium]